MLNVLRPFRDSSTCLYVKNMQNNIPRFVGSMQTNEYLRSLVPVRQGHAGRKTLLHSNVPYAPGA